MLSGRSRIHGLCATSLLLFASTASAQTEEPNPAILWYRSSEGCPDGASFLTLIGDRSGQIRLAEAGDHVDFVVNLALLPEGARGRLERETARGTVAIREVEDASCEKVAEVVALNLSLALDPKEPTHATEDGETAEPTTQPAPPEAKPRSDGGGAITEDAKAPKAQEERSSKPEEQRVDAREIAWHLGLLLGVQSGLSTGLMGRGVLFLEGQGVVSSLPTLTLRGAAVGASGSSDTEIGAIHQSLWAGQLRICPVAWGHSLSLAPCVSGELGQLRAKGPLSDSALWAALGVHLGSRFNVTRILTLEADIGADVPLRKYEIAAGSASLYRTSPVAVSALLGAAIAF